MEGFREVLLPAAPSSLSHGHVRDYPSGRQGPPRRAAAENRMAAAVVRFPARAGAAQWVRRSETDVAPSR